MRFTGVQYDTSQPALSFSFTGIQVNPSLEPPLFFYHEFIAFTGPTVPTLNGSDVIVAINDTAPEPATWAMIAGALIAVAVYRRRRVSTPLR